ncbi:MAG: hypothetical protein EA416_09090 [Trueperaceae bacterium]|nr:MAG: hypothetical protein EA416_09090 [Trueperaceae bacterium]
MVRRAGPLRARSRRSPAVLAAFALLVAASSACVPLFVPPLPSDRLEPEPAFRLHGDARLEPAPGDDAGLVLVMRAAEVPAGGWLAVQWFGPSGPARASESVWFEPGSVGAEVRLETPPGLDVTPGEWRAVLSWDGRLVRQLRIELD